MSGDVLINCENASKKFCRELKRAMFYGAQDATRRVLGLSTPTHLLRKGEFWALDNISFELKRGECLGVIGSNGAGKSTLLKLLNGIIGPDKGRISIRGRVGALIQVGAGFHPNLTGRENIYINGQILGMDKGYIDKRFDEIVDFADIGDFLDTPVKFYSSGMFVRLGFAVAVHMEPDILLLDEVLSVGDANFQAKCFHRIGKNIDRSAVILISHWAYHIKKYCEKVFLLEKGKIVESGTADYVLQTYQIKNEKVGLEPIVVLGDYINNVYFENISEPVTNGGFLEFDLVFDSDINVKCDQCILNIVDGADSVHAQVLISGLEKNFKKGKTRHRVCVGPLHLSFGRYMGNFVFYGAKGKSTLAHLRRCLSFRFVGPASLGPVYYPPSIVHEV